MLLTREQALLPHGLPLLDWHTVFTRRVFVVWVFSFISLQLLVLKPPALRQLSQKESKKRKERKGERIQKRRTSCLAITHALHAQGLCSTLGLAWPALQASVGDRLLGGPWAGWI